MTLRQMVYESLDNALANGDFNPGMSLHGKSNEEIAEDLIEYDADLESCTVEELVPLVQAWWQKV